MREVARRARTTTPTLYERFKDRDALLWGLTFRVQAEILARVNKAKTAEEISKILFDFFVEFPGRLDLLTEYWPKFVISSHPKPVFEKVTRLLMEQRGCTSRGAQETAFSLMALLLGAAMLIRAAGEDSPITQQIRHSSLRAARVLCAQVLAK